MPRTNAPSFLAALVSLALVGAAPASAQAGKAVNFEVSWMFNGTMEGPFATRPISVRMRAQVKLSGTNKVSGGIVRDVGGAQDVKVLEGRLGAGWRVVDANTITNIRPYPNSEQVLTIRTQGSSCTAEVEYRLRPGAFVHLYPALQTRRMIPFHNVSASSPTCVVR